MRYFSTFIAFIAVIMITGVIDIQAVQLKIIGIKRWMKSRSKKDIKGKAEGNDRVKRMKMV